MWKVHISFMKLRWQNLKKNNEKIWKYQKVVEHEGNKTKQKRMRKRKQ